MAPPAREDVPVTHPVSQWTPDVVVMLTVPLPRSPCFRGLCSEVGVDAERLHSSYELLVEGRNRVVVVHESDADDSGVGDRRERIGPVVEDAKPRAVISDDDAGI